MTWLQFIVLVQGAAIIGLIVFAAWVYQRLVFFRECKNTLFEKTDDLKERDRKLERFLTTPGKILGF